MSATATVRRPAVRRAPSPRPQPAVKRHRLRVIPGLNAVKGRRRTPELLAILIICASLFVVVVGNTMLTQGQLRIGRISTQLTQEQAVNRISVLNVAALETPARIQQAATGLHLVQPAQILQLPSVPLDKELPEIRVVPAGAQ